MADPQFDAQGNPIQPAKSKSWLKWLGVGCGGALVFVALLVGGLLFFVWQATAAPEETVKNFLAAAGAGDYQKAHDYFSAPLKDAQPLEVFTKGVKQNPNLFQIEDTTFSTRNLDMNSGAELSGTVTLKAGTKVPASFKLVKENGDWKLIAYSIGS